LTVASAEVAAAVRPSYAASLDFLRRWSPAGPWVLTAIEPDRKGIETRTFGPGSEPAMLEWLAAHGASRNIYFMVNPPTRSLAKKAERTDVAAMAWLHVDIDPRAGEDIDEERERAIRLLRGTPGDVPPPSVVVFSGGGYQGFWKLREPRPIGGELARAEDAKLYNLQLELLFGADNCHNVDRIMRLPGSVNRPDAKKRKKGRVETLAEVVEWHEDRVYDLSQFTKAPLTQRAEGQASQTVKVSGNLRRLSGVDELPEGVGDRCRVVIVQGHDPDEPSKFPSRSEWLFYVCCELVRAGCDDDTIYSVITDPTFAISASVREKGSAAERYAQRQIERARATGSDFLKDGDGRVLPIIANIRIALGKLRATLEHDEFSDTDSIRGIDGFGPRLGDRDATRLRLRLERDFGFLPRKELFLDVLIDEAHANVRHPVREYLAELAWDGTPRVESWLIRYAGAEDTPFVRAVGGIVLVAAVRRVRQPGCKFDEMLVLEGTQGKGKSSMLAALVPKDDWFSDDLPLDADTKRQMESLAGRWIVEAGELKGMRKGETERLKAFLSRRVDRARLAYGRLPTELARQCVVIGTTNSENYLKDMTGNRRFWPVRCGEIDIQGIRRDRDQLWAEAAKLDAEGFSIRLDPALYSDAEREQGSRLLPDPYLEELGPLLADRCGKVKASDVWKFLGKLSPGERTQDDSARLGDAMRKLGWERKKLRFGGEQPEWAYVRGSEAEQSQRIVLERSESGTPSAREDVQPPF
jgi:hypothetical protein